MAKGTRPRPRIEVRTEALVPGAQPYSPAVSAPAVSSAPQPPEPAANTVAGGEDTAREVSDGSGVGEHQTLQDTGALIEEREREEADRRRVADAEEAERKRLEVLRENERATERADNQQAVGAFEDFIGTTEDVVQENKQEPLVDSQDTGSKSTGRRAEQRRTRSTRRTTPPPPANPSQEPAHQLLTLSFLSAKRRSDSWGDIALRLSKDAKHLIAARRDLDLDTLGIQFSETHYVNSAFRFWLPPLDGSSQPDFTPDYLDAVVASVEEYLDSFGMEAPVSKSGKGRVENIVSAQMKRLESKLRVHARWGLMGHLQSVWVANYLNRLADEDTGEAPVNLDAIR